MNYLKQFAVVMSLSLSTVSAAMAAEPQAQYTDSLTLSALSEKVYERLPGKLGEAKFAQLQQANQGLSQSLFAEPVTANLSHFNDAIGSSDGFQEWEGGVDMPLWLPGQKQAQQALSDELIAQLPAYQSQLKLQASGEVRSLIWQLKLAEAELEQAEEVWETAQKLEKDVKSRVEAGDLPNTEALLASSNTLEAHSNMVEAESRLAQQLKTYTLITGEQVLPAEVSESLSTQSTVEASHPQLAMQDQVIARLQAEMGIARYQGAVNPSVSVGVRHERGDRSESYTNSLGVGFSMALNNDRYRQPAIAEASAALADAQVNRRQIERDLNKQLLVSQQSLESTREQLTLIEERDKTTQQYYQLQKRAFDLGEINLIDLLRSQVLANQSHARKRQLEVLIQQKTAEVNQALGLML